MFDLIVLFGFETDENNVHEVDNFVKETESVYDKNSKVISPIYFFGKVCFSIGFCLGVATSSLLVVAIANL